MLGISYLMLILAIMFYKKTQEHVNIIDRAINVFIIIIIYNGIVGILLSLINIKINSDTLIICNFIVILTILYIIISKKKVQKFIWVDKRSIIFLGVLIVSTLLFIILYGNKFNITFETTDPATHMNFIKQFLTNEQLLLTKNSSVSYAHMSNYPFLHYINCGIFHKCIGISDIYKSYIILNIILIILTISKSLSTMMKIRQTKTVSDNIVLFITNLIFLIGYPLNALIFGFSSQIVVFPIIIMIIEILYDKTEQSNSEKTINLIIINLLLIGVFFGYYYYVPEVFFSVGMFILIKLLKSHKKIDLIFLKQLVIIGAKVFIVPLIFGAIYLIYFKGTPTGGVNSNLAIEGYIWRDFLNSLIVFIPIVIYSFIEKFKKKKIGFETIFLVSCIAFSGVLFILAMNGAASSYYYYKNYYVLIIPIMVIFYEKISELCEKNTNFKYTLIIFTLLLATLLFGGDSSISKKNNLINPTPLTYNNVFWFNFSKIKNIDSIYTSDELEFIEKFNENNDLYSKNSKVAVVGDVQQLLWFRELTNIWPKFNTDENLGYLYDEKAVDMIEFERQNEFEYIVIFKRRKEEWINKNIDFNNYNIIEHVGDCYILKKV